MTCSEILIEQKSEPCFSDTLHFCCFPPTPNSEPRPEQQKEHNASCWSCWGSGEICCTMAAIGPVTPGNGSAGPRPPPHFSGPWFLPFAPVTQFTCNSYSLYLQSTPRPDLSQPCGHAHWVQATLHPSCRDKEPLAAVQQLSLRRHCCVSPFFGF